MVPRAGRFFGIDQGRHGDHLQVVGLVTPTPEAYQLGRSAAWVKLVSLTRAAVLKSYSVVAPMTVIDRRLPLCLARVWHSRYLYRRSGLGSDQQRRRP